MANNEILCPTLVELYHGAEAVAGHLGSTAFSIYRNPTFGILMYRLLPLTIVELKQQLPGFNYVDDVAFARFSFKYMNGNDQPPSFDTRLGTAYLSWIPLGQSLNNATNTAESVGPEHELVQVINIFGQYQVISVGHEKRLEIGENQTYMCWNGMVVKSHGYFGMKLFVK